MNKTILELTVFEIRFVSGTKIIQARKSSRLAVWNGIDRF